MWNALSSIVSTAAQVLAGEKTADDLVGVVSAVREEHAARAALPATLTPCACGCYFVPVDGSTTCRPGCEGAPAQAPAEAAP